MPTTLDVLMSQQATDIPYAYTERDTMLYGIAIGMGRDPLDERELDYVYERRGTLRAMPSQAITVARHNLIFEIGMNVEKFLHGEQKLTLHRPFPTSGKLLADHHVLSVADKGVDRGILIETVSKIRLADGTPLFDINNLYFARGDGGIGSAGKRQEPVHAIPLRAPDLVRVTQTEPRQALVYRLTGDSNVIHGDPVIARQMGFKGPVLHGSCTLALACREILITVCEHDNTRIKTLGTRFTNLVYPGERLETDIWVEGNQVSFRMRSLDRGVVVLDHGNCQIAV